MSRWTKLIIGLVAALAAGWIFYGPAGRGNAYLDTVEARAQAVVRETGIAGVTVRMSRDPLSRAAILSGPANDFQREGIGRFPGLNERVAGVTGVSAVRWDPAAGGRPLVAEMLGLVALFYLIGIGLGWLFFRPRHEGYL